MLKDKLILETVNCLICKKNKFKVNKKIIINTKKEAKIVKCKNCGLVYLSPRPKNVELLYSEKYWELNENKSFEHLNKQRTDAVKKTIEKIEKYISKHLNQEQKINILDIGAGDGLFLNSINKKFNRYATEISKSGVNYLKKKGIKNVYCGDFNEINFKEKYDVVNISHVIEHLKNPAYFLKKVKKIMKKESILVISAPNEDSFFTKIVNLPIIRKLTIEKDEWTNQKKVDKIEFCSIKNNSELGERRFLIHNLHHFYFFTPKTIKYLLKINKFKIVYFYDGNLIKTNSSIKNMIKNNFINKLFKFFNSQEELLIFAKI
ncbi:MAG: class I SAM-dependent methyltransferase [Nanoarchaeota archaeon]|nr:class I SAM-dependent methyltransferase [Nanoarchaeota archaeon]